MFLQTGRTVGYNSIYNGPIISINKFTRCKLKCKNSYNGKDFEPNKPLVHENLHTGTFTSAQGKHLEEMPPTYYGVNKWCSTT